MKRSFRAWILLPESDFDPTEAAVPWKALLRTGVQIGFATPSGNAASADDRLLEKGFGPLSRLLMSKPAARELYRTMAASPEFQKPAKIADLDPGAVDLIHVPGGHAKGVKTLLESDAATRLVAGHMLAEKPTSAVCHGVLLLARAKNPQTGRSVLFGRKTTALTAPLEGFAWNLTRAFLGDYYRTYPESVEAEVKSVLERPQDFKRGPLVPRDDTEEHPERGFVVRDRNYVSARFPGDCHALARAMSDLVLEQVRGP